MVTSWILILTLVQPRDEAPEEDQQCISISEVHSHCFSLVNLKKNTKTKTCGTLFQGITEMSDISLVALVYYYYLFSAPLSA